MNRDLRETFNRGYTDDIYRRVCALMEERCEEPSFGFRLAELPLILTPAVRDRLARGAEEILALAERPDVIEWGRAAVPAKYDVPRRDALPHFMSIDFAIVRGADGELEPRLVELQAFSSLYGMELVQGEIWGEVLASMPGMPKHWTSMFSGLDRDAYVDLLRRTVVAGEDSDSVVLLDLEPENQKTRADFHVIQRTLGVRPVCATAVVREGRRLFAPKDGKLVPIRRIFNRIVFDELEKSGEQLAFDWRDDLDVTWVAHPNWYWIWSKATLPLLDHPWVPRARYLSDVKTLPDDLSRYILKPLFSFAGTGVQVDVDRALIDAIPRAERTCWLLQEKIDYAPDVVAPDGARVKAEIRMIFLRPDTDSRLTLAINLARLSRGKMHGVDHNRGLSWVGSSIGIWPAD